MNDLRLLNDDELLDFDCPGCGKQIQERIGWLKQDGYHCPHCGAAFETKEFARVLEEFDQMVADGLRNLPGETG